MDQHKTRASFETFDHDADIGVRGWGLSLAEAFENGARALTSVLTDPGGVEGLEEVRVELEGEDVELLFFAWLSALVYEMATRGMVFAEFHVEIDGGRLRAGMRGERVDVGRHSPAVEVKGPTMTELSVRPGPDGRWLAQCVVDV
jgi:SHS2 domain-containing protein